MTVKSDRRLWRLVAERRCRSNGCREGPEAEGAVGIAAGNAVARGSDAKGGYSARFSCKCVCEACDGFTRAEIPDDEGVDGGCGYERDMSRRWDVTCGDVAACDDAKAGNLLVNNVVQLVGKQLDAGQPGGCAEVAAVAEEGSEVERCVV